MGWREELRARLIKAGRPPGLDDEEDDSADDEDGPGPDDDVSEQDMNALLERRGMREPQRGGFPPPQQGQQQPGTGMQLAGQAPLQIVEPTTDKPRAMFHDPYSAVDWGGWRNRPSALTYDTLRTMSITNPVVGAIINLRINQVASFCTPQKTKFDRGFKIAHRDRQKSKKGMSPVEQREAEAIERYLETTGALLPSEFPRDRDSFRTLCKKFVRDTLTYDQAAVELIRDRGGKPSRFVMLPSETIRPAVSDIEHMDPEELRSRIAYVQVYEQTVIAEFSSDELAWGVMNPRSDIRVNGFGLSPLEQMVSLVTAWLWGFQHNSNYFRNGASIKGLINIKGAIPDRQLRAFRRMWYTMVAGNANAWKTPIVNSEDLQWVPMQMGNKDMEFGAWMDWLCKLTTALYGVDPTEINFIFGNSGQTSSMGQSRPNEEEVKESKDKGLLPLLDHSADYFNRHIIQGLNPDFEFVWGGYDAESEKEEREGRQARVKSTMTVNEARAEEDLPPLEGKLGDVILDSNWIQWAQAQQAAADAAAQQAAGGMPGTPGAPPGDPNQPPGEGQGENTYDDLFGAGHGQGDDDGEGESGDEDEGDDENTPPTDEEQPDAGEQPEPGGAPPGSKNFFGAGAAAKKKPTPFGGPPKKPGAPPFGKSLTNHRLGRIDHWLS
jgi:phage portal protein BeeE